MTDNIQVTLPGPNLCLRPYLGPERDDFVALNTDPVARRHMDGPLEHAQALALFDKLLPGGPLHTLVWAVWHQDQWIGHTFITTTELGWELGIILQTRAHGQGLATEAAKAALTHAAACGRLPVVGSVDDDHAASIRVLEKLGFQLLETRHDEDGPWRIYRWDGP